MLNSRTLYKKQYYTRNRHKILKSCQEDQKLNPDKYKDRNLRFNYGISLDQFKLLERLQAGLCAICFTKPKKELCVDHNHRTGQVRGLLCYSCNFAIGLFKDSVYTVQNAIKYLEAHNG